MREWVGIFDVGAEEELDGRVGIRGVGAEELDECRDAWDRA